MTFKKTISFVGPLPPPLHGFSAINKEMLARLKHVASIRTYDVGVSSWGGLGAWGVLANVASGFYLFSKFLFDCLMQRPTALYIGLSGGLGQLRDALFLVVAKCFRIKVFVHHHTFSYLRHKTSLNRLCLRIVRNENHVVLCDGMSQELGSGYGIEIDRITIISNAAFLTMPLVEELKGQSSRNPLRVGFLSNITRGKGVFEFIDVAKAALLAGIPMKAEIGGPLDAAVASEFHSAVAMEPGINYLGAIYGEEKKDFFRRIDLLIFSSKLEEAEPVTILEALSFGVPIFAIDRGCISCVLAQYAVGDDDFKELAAAEIKRMSTDAEYLRSRRLWARSRFDSLYKESSTALAELLSRMTV